jgi:flagellar basal body-associated protein FliL
MSTPPLKQSTKAAPKKAAAGKTEPKKAAPQKAASKKNPAAESKAPKATQAAAPAGAEKEIRENKARRAKKDKVVRDSFTMPKSDYAKIAELKQRCLEAGVSVKKSELLRAALVMLAAAPTRRLLAAISELDTVKTGRPARE